MKLKDYYKLNRDIHDDNVNRYLKENNISRESYDDGKKKDKNLAIGLSCGLGALLIALCCFSSCSPKPVVTVPVETVNKAVVMQQPLSAFTTGQEFKVHNYSSSNIGYSNSGSVGDMTIPSGQERVCYYNDGDTRDNMSLYNISDYSVYFVPIGDRYNYSTYWSVEYTDPYNFDSFNVTPTDIYIMDSNIESSKLDFSLYNDLRPTSQFAKMIVGQQYMQTNEYITYTKDYNMSTFKLNFIDEYSNLPNMYNKLHFEYTISPVDYGYRYIAEVYAKYNEQYMTKICSNLESTEVSLYFTDSLYDYEDVHTYNSSFGDIMRYAPYLVDTQIRSYNGTGLSLVTSSSPIRGLFLKNSNMTKAYLYKSSSSSNLWDSIGDLIKVTFIALWPIGDIYILPMITIGALIFTPLVVAFIMLIIKVLRK